MKKRWVQNTWSKSREIISHESCGFCCTSAKAMGQRENGLTQISDCFLMGVLCGLGGKLRGENEGEPTMVDTINDNATRMCTIYSCRFTFYFMMKVFKIPGVSAKLKHKIQTDYLK